jgi:N-acetylglucosamine malate deacetylase 1
MFFRRLKDKFQWIQKHHWPIVRSRVQFCGLLFFGSRPIALSPKPALIISPHQDDETLGCGGLIALKCQANIPVEVLFLTDGAASHIWHPQFAQGEIAPVRKQEAIAALELLGVAAPQVHFLDHADGKLKWIDPAKRELIIAQITDRILVFQPGEIYVTHRHDRSNDHEVAYDVVQAAIHRSGLAIDLIEYPIWILWKPVLFQDLKPEELAGARRLAIGPVNAQKQQALQAYKSQYTPIGDTTSTVLPKGFLWRFTLPYELFFPVKVADQKNQG